MKINQKYRAKKDIPVLFEIDMGPFFGFWGWPRQGVYEKILPAKEEFVVKEIHETTGRVYISPVNYRKIMAKMIRPIDRLALLFCDGGYILSAQRKSLEESFE